MRAPILLSLFAVALPAQHRDPGQLLRLQRVLQKSIDDVAPSIVTIETFGGSRKVLTADGGMNDGIGGQRPVQMPPAAWKDLYDELKQRPDFEGRLEKWFPDLTPEQRKALEPKDLRKVDPDEVRKLREEFKEKHGREPGQKEPDPDEPAPKKPEPNKRPRLVQPGFLQAQGATTGVVLSADGWILVSRFALNFDPSTILVTLADGTTYTAERFGEDTSRGIALIKIDAEDLPVPTFVSKHEVEVGQWAFALGRTFGRARPSVHMGIVSATDRLFRRAIQIDAYTSPANYGGPVIDVRGRIMGVSVPLSPSGRDVGVDWYDSGIGFATAVADIGELIDRMKQGEVLHRAWLGIQTRPDFDGRGAQIMKIADDSPAKGIGLQKGDVLIEADGTAVKNAFHLQMLVSSHMAGDPMHLKYRRGGADPVGITVFLANVPLKEREAQTKKEETFTPPWEDGDPDPKKGGG